MILTIVSALIFALSLCADCFAVSLCSSVTLKSVRWKEVLRVALAFAVIQTGLLLAGWAFGSFLAGLLTKIAHIIGFLLLLYVGGSMFIEGIRGEDEVKDLNGLKNVIIGGIATSIDALAVGVSLSMDSKPWGEVMPMALAVFAVTELSVVAGIFGGKTIGSKAGRWAEIAGGLVLVGIGVSILL